MSEQLYGRIQLWSHEDVLKALGSPDLLIIHGPVFLRWQFHELGRQHASTVAT